MKNLNKRYDDLQNIYGSQNLNSVYGYGQDKNPRAALVFMNPTKRNIATDKTWSGLKAQWLGTKQIWEFLWKCGLFSCDVLAQIKAKTPKEWTPEFCNFVYDEIKKQGLWITNLAKCSQDDARPLPDEIFLQYKELLKEELSLIQPQKVFFFGNQVSSIVLDKPITVSTSRQQKHLLTIKDKSYDCYAVYYPVGNGRFNQPKAVEDIRKILNIEEEI
ncbi:MAG: hypothetical protein J6K97_03445 [Clostridia bacterium]|nr:hypothetical protein [Clostridia bacterium]